MIDGYGMKWKPKPSIILDGYAIANKIKLNGIETDKPILKMPAGSAFSALTSHFSQQQATNNSAKNIASSHFEKNTSAGFVNTCFDKENYFVSLDNKYKKEVQGQFTDSEQFQKDSLLHGFALINFSEKDWSSPPIESVRLYDKKWILDYPRCEPISPDLSPFQEPKDMSDTEVNLLEEIDRMNEKFPVYTSIPIPSANIQNAHRANSSASQAVERSNRLDYSSPSEAIRKVSEATKLNSESILNLASAIEALKQDLKSFQTLQMQSVQLPKKESMTEIPLKEKLIETINLSLQEMDKYNKYSAEEAEDAAHYTIAYKDYAFTKGISLEPKEVKYLYDQYLESSKADREAKMLEVKEFAGWVMQDEYSLLKNQAKRLGIDLKELPKVQKENKEISSDISSAAARILGSKISSLIGVVPPKEVDVPNVNASPVSVIAQDRITPFENYQIK